MKRRQWLGWAGAGALMPGWLSGCATPLAASRAKVVVVGGGFGGATAAKYVRMWSDYGIEVTLVEPNPRFVSCPLSNLVISQVSDMDDITLSYSTLVKRHGVTLVPERATAIDADKRIVRLAGGGELPYDRLILSPGVDFMWETLPGMATQAARNKVLHAWKAGPQTLALRQQLKDMPNGGVYAIAVPLAPYRCSPAPYERACLVADYFTRVKPRSKVLILDANEDVLSKTAFFKGAWRTRYPDIVEYRPGQALSDVDAASNTLKLEFGGEIKAQVLNVVPPMRAADIAYQSGLATANQRWCEVDFLTFESKAIPHIHVLGDAIQIAPMMAKSGHMANQHGKVCAAAVVALLSGQSPNSTPIYNNTCYSFISKDEAVHVASVHVYDPATLTMQPVHGAGGLSRLPNEVEARAARAWGLSIWADTLS